MKKIFVSYTTINDEVTSALLSTLLTKINSLGISFIDALHNDSPDRQARVMNELANCNLLVLLISPSTKYSYWVNLEVKFAENHNIPIKEILVEDIDKINEKEFLNYLTL